jgi:rare lipoprotein A (peptidoglycan hydrolase)
VSSRAAPRRLSTLLFTATITVGLLGVGIVVAADPLGDRDESPAPDVRAAGQSETIAVDEMFLSATEGGAAVAELDLPVQPDLVERTAEHPPVQAATVGDATAVGGIFQRGEASWYGPGFAGNTTANGEIYDPRALTAAHPSLPFGTHVRVTNERNGQFVTVRINDRGPFVGGRIIDLSEAAAEQIGMKSSGVAPVTLEIVG